MDALSAVLINKALDGLSMRHMATAQNIANANSPGYRPVRVSFEEQLRSAAMQGEAAVRNVRAAGTTETGPGGELRLDLELATASETAMRYAALIDLLSRQMQISRTIIKGGQ